MVFWRKSIDIEDVYFPCHGVTPRSRDALNFFLGRLRERGFKKVPTPISDAYLHGYNDACTPEKDDTLYRLMCALHVAKGYMVRHGALIEAHFPEIDNALAAGRKLGF